MNPWRQQSENKISLLKDSYDYYRKVDNGAKMITAFEEKILYSPKRSYQRPRHGVEMMKRVCALA